MGPNIGNEIGHWESQAICDLNDILLESAGSNWHDWTPFNPDWYASPKSAEYHNLASKVLTDEFGSSSLFVLKDPRICRFAPFWINVLERKGINPAIIMPVRNPLEVSASLELRDGFPPELGHLLWLRHTLDAEAATRGRARLHCAYDILLDDWRRLALRASEVFGMAWPRNNEATAVEIERFLGGRHRHHCRTLENVIENPMLAGWVRHVYEIFCRWAAGQGEDNSDHATLDRIRAEFDAATPAFARLILLGREAQSRLTETEGQLSAQRDRTSALEGEVCNMNQRLHENQEALAAAHAHADEQDHCVAELISERDQLVEGVESARRQLADAQARLGSLESTLAQRQEEIAQAYAEIAGQKEAAGVLNDMLAESQERSEAAQRKLVEADAWVFRLSAERKAFETQAQRLERRLQDAETKQQQAEAVVRRLSDAEARAEARLAELGERDEMLSHVLEEKSSIETHLNQCFQEIAALTQMLQEKETSLAETQAASARMEAEIREAAEQSQVEKGAAESQLNERFREIAKLSGLLREREALASRSSDEAEWLQEAGSILLANTSTRKGRLLGLLPAALNYKRQQRLLKRKGLFDGDAYLAAYPDVANEGADPLRHYLKHGIKENRRRT